MKVVVSLPAAIVRSAETFARQLKKSRDQIYAEAIVEYVSARGATTLTARLDAIYGKQSSPVDAALKHAQLARLTREARENW